MEKSTIEWTDNTYNPWIGCTKVSPACDNCYAETIASRFGLAEWGPDGTRRVANGDYLRGPTAWNRRAGRDGRREKVFCGSMCDVFEGRKDTLDALSSLWQVIEATTNLDWLLLTKRPNNVHKLAPWTQDTWPENAWVGATIENQDWTDRRLPYLLQIPSPVRFVSVEPMLGPVDLRHHLGQGLGKINWVICGGESGAQARGQNEMPSWYRDLRDQCVEADVPFFFKQWGRFAELAGGLVRLRGKNPNKQLDGVVWQEFPST